MAEYAELEDFIMQKININTIMSENDFLEALSNLSSSEQRRLKAKGDKPGKAMSIIHFGEDKYYEDFNSKIGDRIDVFKEWEKKVDSYFDKTDKATSLDELAQFEKEISGKEWSYRLDEQIKYKKRVLQTQSDNLARQVIDKIRRASASELRNIDPDEYKGKVSDNAIRRIQQEWGRREREVVNE